VRLGFRSQRACCSSSKEGGGGRRRRRRSSLGRRARRRKHRKEEEEEAWEAEPEGGSIWRSWEKLWSKRWSGWSTHRFCSFRFWLLVFDGVWFGGNPKKNMKERGAWRRRRTWKGEESVNKSAAIFFLFWLFSPALLCVMVAFEFRLHMRTTTTTTTTTAVRLFVLDWTETEMRKKWGAEKGRRSLPAFRVWRETWKKESFGLPTYLLRVTCLFYCFCFCFLFFAFLFTKGSFF